MPEQRDERGQQRGRVLQEPLELRLQTFAEVLGDGVDERVSRAERAVENGRALARGALGEDVDEARLADAGLALEQHHGPRTPSRTLPGFTERLALPVTPVDARPAPDRDLHAALRPPLGVLAPLLPPGGLLRLEERAMERRRGPHALRGRLREQVGDDRGEEGRQVLREEHVFRLEVAVHEGDHAAPRPRACARVSEKNSHRGAVERT